MTRTTKQTPARVHPVAEVASLGKASVTRRQFAIGAAASPILLSPTRSIASVANKRPLVVLDPGHGGHDPGAVGITGLLEKHVALETALELKAALEQQSHCRVVLTRDDDTFIPLHGRIVLAEKHAAQMFVSIHANALSNPHVRGASVFTGSKHASDAQAAEIAMSENAADGADSNEFADYSPAVENILEDLMSRTTRMASVILQRSTTKALSSRVDMVGNPNRHANLAVLRSSAVPSVLVEMAFMSNTEDEQLLQTAAFRTKIVKSLKGAIEASLKRSLFAPSST